MSLLIELLALTEKNGQKKHYIKSNGSNIAGPFDSEDEAEAALLKLQRRAKPEDELDDAEIVLEAADASKLPALTSANGKAWLTAFCAAALEENANDDFLEDLKLACYEAESRTIKVGDYLLSASSDMESHEGDEGEIEVNVKGTISKDNKDVLSFDFEVSGVDPEDTWLYGDIAGQVYIKVITPAA